MRYGIIACVFLLAACGPTQKDYQASAKCQGQGHAPGTEAFDDCVKEESAARLMEEQRREYEQMKQYDRDWKMRQY